MAEQDDQERTEQPTSKREEDARRDGQVARSQEMSTCVVLVAAATALMLLGGRVGEALVAAMRHGLELTRSAALDESQLVPALSRQLFEVGLACLPIFGVVVLAVLIAPLAIGGWNFTTKALEPKFSRLDPIAGFGRIFSLRGFIELWKAFAKFGLVAAIAVWTLWRSAPQLMGLGAMPVDAAIGQAIDLVTMALLALAAALVVIAGLDVPYQLWRHAKELRMTRDQIRQEHKESDGSPEVKGRIRQIQQTLARGRMLQDVPTADVVVTNPTHFAVALRYEDARMRAPIVVAKGTDLIAARIRELAAEHGVPIVEAPPLARALHRGVEIGSEIPATLYAAVAQVLTYVFQLRMARQSGATPPPPPPVTLTP